MKPRRPPAPAAAPRPAQSPAETRFDAALAMQRAGRTPQAVALYEQVLQLDPRSSAARHNLGLIRLQQGALASAVALLEQAFVEDGANDAWLGSLPTVGLTLVRHGCWEDALPWLGRAAARLPDDHPARAEVLHWQQRTQPRAYLAPEVWDPLQQRSLRRHAPRESATYVYAIDVVGTCNLRCPTCPVGNSPAAERPKGFMEPELFERVLDKIVAERVADRPEVWLFNWGEPLLHPELPALITAVKRRGLRCHLSTNLNVERSLREVVRAAPDDLKVSLSGFTPETYARTHVRGHLALVKSNLYRLRHDLDRCGVATRVWVGHHLYKGTESQVADVAALCRELGFEHHPMPAFYMPLERLVDVLDGRRPPDPTWELLIQAPPVYLERIRGRRSEQHDCELRFNQTVINHDGSVALCCCVYERENMLGLSFLDTPHAELEAAKYRHPMCRTCMARGLSFSVVDASRVGLADGAHAAA